MSGQITQIGIELPEKLAFLVEIPMRYKVARGGRGSAKSWSFARAILAKGRGEPLRILCAREVQKSIDESVHQLLKDQIDMLGMGDFYEVFRDEIRGANGTTINYSGLLGHTVTSLKSFERCDICWVEEGQTVSEHSWRILTPTIRADDSEIWVSYNPELDTDPTHKRFTINKPDDCINVLVNYHDNPWFNDVLEKERLHCLKNDPDGYPNIWLGECRPAVEGAIYYKQMAEAERQGRVCRVPYNPMLKVHLVTDIGKGNSLFVALVQVHQNAIIIIESIDGGYNDWNTLSAHLKAKDYNWGKWWLPHDGYTSTINSEGKSSSDILKALGWNVAEKEEIVQLPVEEGIRNARVQFYRMYFDRVNSASIVECAKRYKRHISKTTNVEGGPLADQYSHGGDTIRYIAANADKMSNEDYRRPMVSFSGIYQPRDRVVGL